MNKTLVIVIGACAVILTTGRTVAGPITFAFEGQITHILDPNDLLGGAVTVGAPFSGSITFESSTPDSEPTIPWVGRYPDAITAVYGQVGGISFTGPQPGPWVYNAITVVNDRLFGPPADFFSFDAGVGFLSEIMGFRLWGTDLGGLVFSDDSLLLAPPGLDQLELQEFFILDETIPFGLWGELTLLVPEPTTVVLLLLGCAGLFWHSQRRVQQRHTISNARYAIAHESGRALIAFLVLTGAWTAPAIAQTTDCNGNGIEDASELLESTGF